MKRILFLLLLLSTYVSTYATGAITTGGQSKTTPEGPIDTNAIILIIAAAVLILGVVAYKKLSLRRI